MDNWNSVVAYREGLKVKRFDDLNKTQKMKFSTIINESIKEVIEVEGYELFQSFDDVDKIVFLVKIEVNEHLESGYYDHILKYNFEIDKEEFVLMIHSSLNRMKKKKPTVRQVEVFNLIKNEFGLDDLIISKDFLIFEQDLGRLLNLQKKIGKPTTKQINTITNYWGKVSNIKLVLNEYTDKEEVSAFFEALKHTSPEAAMQDYIYFRMERLKNIIKKDKSGIELSFIDKWYLKNDVNYRFLTGHFLKVTKKGNVILNIPEDLEDFSQITNFSDALYDTAIFEFIDKDIHSLPFYFALVELTHSSSSEKMFSLNDLNEYLDLSEFEAIKVAKILKKDNLVTIEKRNEDYYFGLLKNEQSNMATIGSAAMEIAFLAYKKKYFSYKALVAYFYMLKIKAFNLQNEDISEILNKFSSEIIELERNNFIKIKKVEFFTIVSFQF